VRTVLRNPLTWKCWPTARTHLSLQPHSRAGPLVTAACCHSSEPPRHILSYGNFKFASAALVMAICMTAICFSRVLHCQHYQFCLFQIAFTVTNRSRVRTLLRKPLTQQDPFITAATWAPRLSMASAALVIAGCCTLEWTTSLEISYGKFASDRSWWWPFFTTASGFSSAVSALSHIINFCSFKSLLLYTVLILLYKIWITKYELSSKSCVTYG